MLKLHLWLKKEKEKKRSKFVCIINNNIRQNISLNFSQNYTKVLWIPQFVSIISSTVTRHLALLWKTNDTSVPFQQCQYKHLSSVTKPNFTRIHSHTLVRCNSFNTMFHKCGIKGRDRDQGKSRCCSLAGWLSLDRSVSGCYEERR